ncbi:hypothetical protein TWF506_009222 [Arthrobotrys conoides]|uniref:Uncharacterized protein n=1 Tax=Arthrobotrys conoides TaxID=74498 RepID=A0AAN8RM57_9PEZI
MGQYWSAWYDELVMYEPTVRYPGAPYDHMNISGLYGDERGWENIQVLFFKAGDSESLLYELRKSDIIGLITEDGSARQSERNFVNFSYAGSKRALYIIGEDEISASILREHGHSYMAVYPEKYRGYVPYFIGCDQFQDEEFSRPRRLAARKQKRYI